MKYLLALFLVAAIVAVAQNPENSLLKQGHELFNEGEYSKAETKLKVFLKASKQNSNQVDAVNALYLLGLIANEQARYPVAIGFLVSAEQKLQATSAVDANKLILIQSALGSAYLGAGQFFSAEKKLMEAISMAEKIDPVDASLLLHTRTGLAAFYVAAMNFDKAEKILSSEILSSRQNSTVLKTLLAEAINALGEIYLETNRLLKAKVLFDEADALCKSNWTSIHPKRQNIRRNQVTVARKMGKNEEAIALARSVYVTSQVSLGDNHPNFALAAAELGILHCNQYFEEDYRKAVEYLTEAKNILEKTSSKHHPRYAAILSHLAWAKYKLSWFTDNRIDPRNTEADKLFRESLAITYEHMHNIFPALSEAERKKYYENLEPVFKNFADYAKGTTLYDSKSADKTRLGDWYDMVLAMKGLLFHSNTLLRQRILSSGNTEQIRKFNVWQALRDSLAVAYQKNDEKGKATWMEQVTVIEKELSHEFPILGRAISKKVTWRDVQKALKPNEAAVEIVQYDEIVAKDDEPGEHRFPFYGALVIRYDKKIPELIPLSKLVTVFKNPETGQYSFINRDAEALDTRWFKNYKSCILFDIPDYTSYLIYWRPLDLYLQGIKKIYFSPEGVYNILNLATIRVPNAQERYNKKSLIDLPLNPSLNPEAYHFSENNFLGDVIEIENVLSTKDIVVPTQPLDKLSNVILFGYPDYNSENSSGIKSNENRGESDFEFMPVISADTSQRFVNGGNITELPGTKVEVETIRELLRAKGINSQIFTESIASEAELKKIQNPSVLHIATHGYFLSKQHAGNNAIAEHPLMQSGLLFSGAKQAFSSEKSSNANNGVLTGWEAVALRLDDTRLVVLSACETGLGVIQNGDGVYGLQRAFQLAGAKAVLMSLWTVPDQATQQLMTEFYNQWLTGLPMRTAFNKAQQKIRQQYPDPHSWGGFVLIGN